MTTPKPRGHGGEHSSRWAAVVSVASKIGCSGHTLKEGVQKARVDSGRRAGVPAKAIKINQPVRLIV